jgi:hypothetical protein
MLRNIYNVICTNADTEYSQEMPANCCNFEFQARTEVILRYAFATGKVATPTAPYATLKAGDYWYEEVSKEDITSPILYLASPTAGTVVEIIARVPE